MGVGKGINIEQARGGCVTNRLAHLVPVKKSESGHCRPGWTWEKAATITMGLAGQELSLLLPDQQTALPSTAVSGREGKGKVRHGCLQFTVTVKVTMLMVIRQDSL